MQPEESIANRFIIEREVATGGMSRVYRAIDEQTGDPVALKIIGKADPQAMARFLREGTLLAGIKHPGIVRYIAHGRLSESEAYLAMEWLDGVTLNSYLKRPTLTQTTIHDQSTLESTAVALDDDAATRTIANGGEQLHSEQIIVRERSFPNVLSIEETFLVGRRLASAVSELHRRSIIHRDIKPSNLFLRGGRLSQVVLLDMGIARNRYAGETITAPGSILGTPHYMAPEQATSHAEVCLATDVWAIGCVLYVCLTGFRPFRGTDPVTVLSSVLASRPVPVVRLRPEVPDQLGELIMSMLRKSPRDRPHDANALSRALDELEYTSETSLSLNDSASIADSTTLRITAVESRVATVLLARAPYSEVYDEDALSGIASGHDAELQTLVDGTHLVTMSDTLPPADQAALGARVALAFHQRHPELTVALITGRMEGKTPRQSTISAAVERLRRTDASTIDLDELTASLLEARFHIARDDNELRLGPPRSRERTRNLLGKPSRWVGRRRELALLGATFDECVEDEVARAILVTGPAGMGKSRLGDEFVGRLRRDNELTLISGQGDAGAAGSPFVMIAPALRRLVDIDESESPDAQRDKLKGRIAGTVPSDQVDRVTTFMGELVGIPCDECDNTGLRRARRDPMFMGQLMQEAWLSWLDGECRKRPVLFFLDDLHWGDFSSVQYLDSALRTLVARPLMVVALARPEVKQLFPQLWTSAYALELPLQPLSRKAAKTLVRSTLGDDIADHVIDSLVAHADGNPFYLEELIAAVDDGRMGELPDTILGMVQTRLDALGAEAKRVLRAASIFGEIFWRDGVGLILGDNNEFELPQWLDNFVERGIIRPEPASRLPGQIQYRFRHALIRDSAYGMLTEEDRRVGHSLAGSWLIKAGERDSLILAEHLVRGENPQLAAIHFWRAGTSALEGNDLEAVIQCADRALRTGVRGEMFGQLRVLQSVASYWMGDYAACLGYGSEVASLVEPGSAPWYAALASAIVSCFRINEREQGNALIAEVTGATCAPGAEIDQLNCLARIATQLILEVNFAEADRVLARIDELAADTAQVDTRTVAQIATARAHRAEIASDWSGALGHFQRSVAAFEASGDRYNLFLDRSNYAHALAEIGCHKEAIELCQSNLADCQPRHAHVAARLVSNVVLGHAEGLGFGHLDRARKHIGEAVIEYHKADNVRMEGWALGRLTTVEHQLGSFEAEDRASARVVVLIGDWPLFKSWALALRARALLVGDRPDEALEFASRAVRATEQGCASWIEEFLAPLVLARALHATGDDRGARAVVDAAVIDIKRRANLFSEPEWRDRWMQQHDIQQILELAEQWAE
ncbi:MAG: protein kinase [Proteobacteria bacterium]|nr:protein kinase [Pseudomonadota bacterium]